MSRIRDLTTVGIFSSRLNPEVEIKVRFGHPIGKGLPTGGSCTGRLWRDLRIGLQHSPAGLLDESILDCRQRMVPVGFWLLMRPRFDRSYHCGEFSGMSALCHPSQASIF